MFPVGWLKIKDHSIIITKRFILNIAILGVFGKFSFYLYVTKIELCPTGSITSKNKGGEGSNPLRKISITNPLFNWPGVAGAVLQSPPWLINWFSDPLVQISSKHCQSKTWRARELKFGENVHPTLCVMCRVSRVMCHVSRVMCDVSPVTCIFFLFFFFFFCLEKNFTKWRS